MVDAPVTVEHEGRTVAAVKTDSSGHFRVPLPQGSYKVLVGGGKPGFGRCGPFEVKVATGEFQNVEWHCDSGIR